MPHNSRSTSMSGRKRTTTGGGGVRGRSSTTVADDVVDSSSHAGLVNIGNSCYANSVLQAAGATQVLRELYQGIDARDASNSEDASHGSSSSQSRRNDLQITRLRSPAVRVADLERGRAPLAPYAPILSSPPYQPTSSDLPLGSAFRYLLESLWTAPSRAGTRATSINPKALINKLATKFDQYGDNSQQDGHELLRHLLDAIRMEELDLVKKLQPPQTLKKKRRHSLRDQPSEKLGSSIARPLTAAVSSATPSADGTLAVPAAGAIASDSPAIAAELPVPSDLERMLPFVDILFCGKLASMVICESCKHISHTEEDFLDISLSVKPEEPRAKKRDRFKSMADRWRRATLRPPSRPTSALDMRSVISPLSDADASDVGGSGPADVFSGGEDKDKEKDGGERGRFHLRKTSLHKKSSKRGKGKNGLVDSDADVPDMPDMASMMLAPVPNAAGKTSGSSSEDVTQRAKDITMSPPPPNGTTAEPLSPITKTLSAAVSPNASAASNHRSARSSAEVVPVKANGHHAVSSVAAERREGTQLSTAQAAYIGKLFADLPAPSPAAALLQRLQGTAAQTGSPSTFGDVAAAAASAHHQSRLRWFGDAFQPGHLDRSDTLAVLEAQASTGLAQALRNFTAVEALEGENAFACKRCYRIQHPLTEQERREARMRRAKRRLKGTDGESSSDSESDFDDALDSISGHSVPVDLNGTAFSGVPADAASISSTSSSESTNSSEEATEAMYASTVSAPGDLGLSASTPATSESTVEDSKPEREATLLAPIPRRPGPVANIDFDKTATPRSAGAVLRTAQAAAMRTMQQGGEAEGPLDQDVKGNSPGIPHIEMTEPDNEGEPSQTSASTTDDSQGGLGLQLNGQQKLSAPRPRIGALRLGPSSSGSESDVGESSGYDTGDDETDGSVARREALDTAAPSTSSLAPSNEAAKSSRPSRGSQSIARRALKRYLISSAPPVLVFHFKRFQTSGSRMGFGGGVGTFKKFDEVVSFPEILDVEPWMAPPREEYDRRGRLKNTSDKSVLDKAKREAEATEAEALAKEAAKQEKERKGWGWRAKSPSGVERKAHMPTPQPPKELESVGPSQRTRYRLYAVVVHQGSMQSGHYTSYVLSDRVRIKGDANGNAVSGTSTPTAARPWSNARSSEATGWLSTPGSRSTTPAPLAAASIVRPTTAAPTTTQAEEAADDTVGASLPVDAPASIASTSDSTAAGASVGSATTSTGLESTSSLPTSLPSDNTRTSLSGTASDVSPAPSLLADEPADAAQAQERSSEEVVSGNAGSTDGSVGAAPTGARVEWEEAVEAREAARRTRSKERRWGWDSRSSGGTEGADRRREAASTERGAPATPAEVDDGRRWVYCSDTIVRPVSVEEVLKAKAYLLFYEQL